MIKYKVFLCLTLCLFVSRSKVVAQWSVPASTNFITATHSDMILGYGFNLEEVGNNTELFIENNFQGVNQQVFYFGHANSSKNIFGISTSSDAGGNWSSRFVVNQNGNVGIGTPYPQSTLGVNGKITAKEIQVTSVGWSDFVFDKRYHLPSLSEVEKFVHENGHLPEIPSAREVDENGINLGEMDAGLLQKIEEITLYLIEQKKQIKEITTENRALRNKITELERKYDCDNVAD